MILAKYYFIPWVRQGLSTQVETLPREDPGDALRAKIRLALKINQKPESETVSKEVELLGPGDVVGFDQSIVVRTDPKNNVGDFEPNFFPIIEFWEEGFPWMVTPARKEDNPWQPWVCLIVLRKPKNSKNRDDDEGEFFEPLHYDDSIPTPYITVKNPKESLPNLKNTWAWAHTQVTALSSDSIDAIKLKEIIERDPVRVISHLLCPRRLQPGVLYTAFVVPTFESGRRAGLGQPLNGVKLLDMAWDVDDNDTNRDPLEIPYYYRFEFRTGLRGDFEYLVRLLEPRPLDNRVGKRDIDSSEPGFGISIDESLKPLTLGLEGAMKHVDSEFLPCPESLRQQIMEKLNIPETLIEQGAPGSERPCILPPIYGRWHAAAKKVRNTSLHWFKTLNLDPRHRATANFGTEVIQSQQESLMHEAWRQIGAVEEANQRLREAQAAEELNRRILKEKLSALHPNTFIQIAAPLHARVLGFEGEPRQSLKGYLDGTALPGVVFDSGFRKAFRKRGIIRLRQQNGGDEQDKELIDRMNEGEVQGAGPAPPADGSGSLGELSEELRPPWAKGCLWKIMKSMPLILLILFVLGWGIVVLLNLLGITIPYSHPVFLSIEAAVLVIVYLIRRISLAGRIADSIIEEKITPAFLETARPPAGFPNAEEFRSFAKTIQVFLNQKPEQAARHSADLDAVYTHLLSALDPRKTILEKMKSRIAFRKGSPEIIDQIMAAPEFTHPMYEPLRDLSQDFLLPGLEYIQQNTITLLETNRAFIEAYMVGLNVEFASEMLWREYPTDQRCTCFRKFWDTTEVIRPSYVEEQLRAGVMAEKAEILDAIEDEGQREQQIQAFVEQAWTELLKDINPIHRWKRNELGRNKGQSDQSLQDNLVLLIRGDLLRKYPNTVIYAVKARWNADTTRDRREPDFSFLESEPEESGEGSGSEESIVQYPIFKGTLNPDITFLGFNLTEDQARGSVQRYTTDGSGGTVENDPGWFFVIEERISESRFGLDAYLETDPLPEPATEWDDLSWGHFYEQEGDVINPRFSAGGYIDGAAPRENIPADGTEFVPWGEHSGNIAYITHQKPVRIAVHADDMLPE